MIIANISMITQNYAMGFIIIVIYTPYNTQQAFVRRPSCNPHGSPVCGYNEGDETIAKFEDECALFRVNCRGRGYPLFKIVDDSICKKKVVPKTTVPTTVTYPTIDYYEDLRPETEPDTSTHYWQDSLMLGRYEDGGALRDKEPPKYEFQDLMTII
ncbi:uncharacterized protein LOC125232469 isoform X2 [Leguminivora glycinivorella]|uniref:uncharacterized protein LOC125232469 isoform X2 n=1 Tax=Leguminivora glycinivorella TaxID=1035111 RepID=UPI00200F7854|nr:uncharacterized protein LOC125232469 isoform X2 [Leguminivora glycinivorella]